MFKQFMNCQHARLASGAVNRRQFIRSIVAAGVAVPVAMQMADTVLAATPKKGGHIKFGRGHGSTTDSLDPTTSENGYTVQLNMSYANCLTEVNHEGVLVPELAESVTSDDAQTWVFKLRRGVEFHNGKSLTPEDVIATINLHRGDTKSAVKGLMAPIVDMRKDGKDTVVISLDSKNADFPYLLSDYHLPILPLDGDAINPVAGIGTGGYILHHFDPGVKAEFTRNPNYWKPDSAHFDEVELLALLDVAARQNAVMNGEVDAIDRVDPKTVALLQRALNLNITEVTGTLHYTFPMRVDAAPFDNLDLRLALKYSLNRQEMVDKILRGHGSRGNDHPISTANRYHASDLPQREFDPEQAAHYYRKSGHRGPIQLSTSDAAFAGAVDAAQLFKATAAQAGIEIDVLREPKDGYWSNVWNKKPWCTCYWGGRATEDWMFASAYVADTEWNDTAWRTTPAAVEFNKLVVEARGELDDNKRRALYAQCQKLIHDDGGAIVAMFANYIHAVDKKVAHTPSLAANWEFDGGKAAERWWFA